MRPEKLYLTDIMEAADAIERFCGATNYEGFLGDELRRSAILQKLIVIGEAAARLSRQFRWKIVWVTATEDVPALRRQVAQILATEYANE